MKRSRFSEEQIAYALRQADGGTPVWDACRRAGGSEATFYQWKKKFAHLGVNELRHLRQFDVSCMRARASRIGLAWRPVARAAPAPFPRIKENLP